jgi:hypothetical protein
MGYQRDPVSELFDSGARRLLQRAYQRPGQWVGTRIADPAPRHVAYFADMDIDVTGPDNAPTASGRRDDARSRWCRGFVRAVYYTEKWYGGHKVLRSARLMTPNQTRSVVIEVGRRVPATGAIPAGRAVRVKTVPGGDAARRAAMRKPEVKRIFDDDGEPAGRWSDPAGRDWL